MRTQGKWLNHPFRTNKEFVGWMSLFSLPMIITGGTTFIVFAVSSSVVSSGAGAIGCFLVSGVVGLITWTITWTGVEKLSNSIERLLGRR